jgi:hypothetical protein
MTRPTLALTALAALTLGTIGDRETQKEAPEPLTVSDILLVQADPAATDAGTKPSLDGQGEGYPYRGKPRRDPPKATPARLISRPAPI